MVVVSGERCTLARIILDQHSKYKKKKEFQYLNIDAATLVNISLQRI